MVPKLCCHPIEEGPVIELEVLGNETAIIAAKIDIAALSSAPLRSFHHKGASGDAGVYGFVTSVTNAAVPKLIDVVKKLVTTDRDLNVLLSLLYDYCIAFG
jgi:hypothetical protein